MSKKVHRLAKRHPELGRFASKEDADRVVKTWKKRIIKTPRFWIAQVGYTVGIGVLVAGSLILFRPWLPIRPSWYGGIVGGITGASGVVVLSWFWRKRFRAFLRQELVAQGVPICLKCGYDLRGQVDPRCPECGTPCDEALIKQADAPGA